MRFLLSILFIAASVALLLIPGCNPATGPGSGTGTLQVNMIDSPAGYDQVNIVVDSVQAHISTSDTTGGWTTLNRTPATYNLLTLVNGANAVLGSATLPVGQYSQIRLYIGTGSNIVVNGVTKPLVTPSGSQSGLKLNVDATVQQDVTYVLTLDFDANRSIVVTGAPSPTYILKPVIRVVTTATTGSIVGTVSPASAKPAVWAYSSTDTVSTFADTTSGAFKLLYLNPATYKVWITPKDTSLYRDTTITSVTVTAGATTNLGTITLTHK